MKLERYISDNYLREQKYLHSSPKGYGGRGDKWLDAVINLARKHHVISILDYGCGKGTLAAALRQKWIGADISEYDPAIAGKDNIEKYRQFDMVVCTDVLEHVEPQKLPIVIEHLYSLTKKVLFLVVATRPSNKFFTDGRNVHLIIEPPSWWKERIDHPLFSYEEPPKPPGDKVAREWIAVLVRNE